MPVAHDLLTNISETDKLIFRRLANRSKVDLSSFKENSTVATPPRPKTRTPVRTPPRTPDHKHDTPRSFIHSPPGRPPQSLFAQAVKSHDSPKLAPPPPLPGSFRPDSALKKILSGAAPPPPAASPRARSPPRSPSRSPPRSPLRHPEDANEKRLKHALLLQLSKMKQMKVPLTRDFTMEDSIDDIQFEIDHQENNTAVINAVNMGKGIIGVGFNVLELGNNRIGPFLNLSGLGQSACVNMDRYNGPLEKIYRKYFRKHAQNPIQELLFLIGGTIVMTHLGNKGGPLIKALLTMFLGGGSGGGNSAHTINDAAKAFKSQSTPPSAPPETAFTQRGYDPRNVPPPTFAAPSAPPAPPSTTRKTLRRPGFSDGGGGGAQYFIPPQPQQPQAPTPSVQIPAPPTTAPAPPPPKPVLVPPPPPPPPIRHPPTPATVLVFPLAGTPVRGNIRRGDTETHMSLPTVIEEIVEETKPKLADAVVVEPDEDDHEDLSSTAFETLMREVLAEDEEKEEVKM